VNVPKHRIPPLARELVFTAKAMREAFEAALAAEGATLGTWVVLSALSDVGLVSQAALASHVHLEGATITHHIDRLEAAGLVRRTADPDDRRVRRLELTDAGRALYERLLVGVARLERTVMGGLSAADRETLGRVLGTIQEQLAGLPTNAASGE
jgi:MarR family transcriptional regulator for hemolysin